MRVPVLPLDLLMSAVPSRPAKPTAFALPAPLKVALGLLIGTILGLGTTAWLVDRQIDFAAVRVGPWVVWPKSGTSNIDPYARAIYAQSGQIALASVEGVLLLADTDDAGAPLTGRCNYRITGEPPPARFWTLGVTTTAGTPIDNAAGRYAFTSAEVLRRSNGSLTVEAAPSVRPGNWLPVSGADRFVLSLRLYDSPLGSGSVQPARSAVPSIQKEDCP